MGTVAHVYFWESWDWTRTGVVSLVPCLSLCLNTSVLEPQRSDLLRCGTVSTMVPRATAPSVLP